MTETIGMMTKKIREERSVNMGKHDIRHDNDYYIARIKRLEMEVASLTEDLKEAERNIAILTNMYEQSAQSVQRNEERSDAIIEQKNEEIEMAKEAIYLAAMREVSLR